MTIEELDFDELNEIDGIAQLQKQQDMSLEDLTFLVNHERVAKLETNIREEFKGISDRNARIKRLHQLIQAVNTATDSKGNLDISNNKELQELIRLAKEELGVELPLGKNQFNALERDRLVDNIRMSVDDLNVENDLQLQKVSRLNNERQESYQLAKSILKTLHEVKVRQAQNMSR